MPWYGSYTMSSTPVLSLPSNDAGLPMNSKLKMICLIYLDYLALLYKNLTNNILYNSDIFMIL